jgi:hypothetical protein
MNAEIYYFSGTGNSLHVAKELQTRLPGARLAPIWYLKSYTDQNGRYHHPEITASDIVGQKI